MRKCWLATTAFDGLNRGRRAPAATHSGSGSAGPRPPPRLTERQLRLKGAGLPSASLSVPATRIEPRVGGDIPAPHEAKTALPGSCRFPCKAALWTAGKADFPATVREGRP